MNVLPETEAAVQRIGHSKTPEEQLIKELEHLNHLVNDLMVNNEALKDTERRTANLRFMHTYIADQKEFSIKTFGPDERRAGIVKHLRKELIEIEQSGYSDLEEWIDAATLAFDGAWRSGFSAIEVSEAMEAKLRKNKSRDWPDWRKSCSDEAIEHIRDGEEN